MVRTIIGDFRKVYNLLEDNSIDCVITSPRTGNNEIRGLRGK
jgi:DNA modification methylase